MAKKSPEDKNTPRQPLSQRPGAAAAGVGGGPTQGLPEQGLADAHQALQGLAARA